MSGSPGRPSLADLTTLRVGGPAGEFMAVHAECDLVAVVRESDRAGRSVLVLGGGSNLLVDDAGVPGLVVAVRTQGVRYRPEPDGIAVTVAAGVPWDDFVAACVEDGLSGVEALSGIPGCTGATPVQNVGAYGQEIAAILVGVRVLDRRSGVVRDLPAAACGLGYRTSILKRDPARAVVLDVTLRLVRSARSAPVRYQELADRLGVAVGDQVPLAECRSAVLDLRRRKGMVLDPDDHDTWSAGSFFTNPVLGAAAADRLPAAAPRWPQPDGRVKTSAAWLIEQAGFGPGFALRPGAPAALSSRHVLALTNRGGACAADLLDLARVVRAGVQARFGVLLEPEPVLVGCRL